MSHRRQLLKRIDLQGFDQGREPEEEGNEVEEEELEENMTNLSE